MAHGANPARPLEALPAPEGSDEAPSTEELFREADAAFSQLFSTKAPRDVFAGVWSAAQCILSGVVLGVAGAIIQPIQGMQSEGFLGCFKGIASGLCTGLFLSVTGVCTGVFQAVRGTLATPKALCMASKGKQWDREAGTWVEPRQYLLPEEAAKVLGNTGDEEEDEEAWAGSPDTSAAGSGSGSASASTRRVADSYYYDQLGVSPSASQQTIRKAYFQQSRKWHPDKTEEPQAKERFQVISEAYQVLSDPARRRAYDAQGRQGAGEGFVDARTFFSVLLGADILEPFIGRLRLAEMFGSNFAGGAGGAGGAAAGDGDGGSDFAQQRRDAERADARQVRREVRLALTLVERLQSYSGSGQAASFKAAACLEAQQILGKDASLERFVMEIGWVYHNRAEVYLASQGSRLGSYGAQALRLQLQSRGHDAQQQANTARLAVSSLLKLRKIVNETGAAGESAQEQNEASEPEGSELPSSLASALPIFMETFWSLSARDITGTLQKVIERVLADGSVDLPARRLRAEGLRVLGEAFMEEAAASSGRSPDQEEAGDERQCRRFEEAFIASVTSGGARAPE